MARTLTSDTSGDVTETFSYDEGSDTVIVRRSQDAQPVLDHVAAVNVDGVREIPGLGRLVAEVPITVAMHYCEVRGIPWEKFCYTQEMAEEWRLFLEQHPALCFRTDRTQFAVSG